MPRTPKLCLHKATGQGYVTLDGKVHYCGKFDTPACRERYDRLILEWRRRHDVSTRFATTIGQLALAFMEHAETYYRHPDGRPTGETANFRVALKPLIRSFRSLPASEFGPRKLDQVRQALVDRGLVRTEINKHVCRIRHLFRWGVSQELVPADVLTALQSLPPLKRGRTEARESDGVQPVDPAHIEAVLPLLTPPVAAMVRLQLLTGARPSEVRLMQVGEIDMTGEVWLHRPARHKNAWRQRPRTIFIGPRGQDLLIPTVTGRHKDEYVFRPHDGRRQFVESAYRSGAAVHVTNATTENRPYTLHGYSASIARACQRAGVPRWSPGRLRHNVATSINRAFGDMDASRVVLGHSERSTTEIYVERDLERAAAIVKAIG